MVELMVAVATAMIVMFAVFGLIQVTLRSSATVTSRVDANQRARVVMQRLIDDLHSACVAPNTTPVLAGSTATSVSFMSQTGSSVSVTPDKHVVSLSSGALSESIYPATGGAAPIWTFAGTPSTTRQLMTDVSATNPPLFRYYAYQSGQLSTTPLPTPLSAADAARAVHISVSFSVAPRTTPVPDPNASVTVSDSAILAFSPADEDTTQANPPCA